MPTTARRPSLMALAILLGALGVAAVLIGLSVLLLGPGPTAAFTEAQYDLVTGGAHPATGAWPATMDSELRFYAPFWAVYGLVLLDAARNLPARLPRVPLLAGLFFVGGLGRALSYATVGPPHPAFVMLMATELIAPPIFLALWARARR